MQVQNGDANADCSAPVFVDIIAEHILHVFVHLIKKLIALFHCRHIINRAVSSCI